MPLNGYEDKTSTVCVDANEVKRIRDEMQLTQLYISKVVGVTTDTISRWENNRYPTIRRENAIKLAEALDVSLDDILLKTSDNIPEDQSKNSKKSPLFWSVMFAFALVILVVFAGTLFKQSEPQIAIVTADRVMPNFAAPGTAIPVQIRLDHRDSGGGVIVREYFPKGWKIIQANPPASSLDNIHGVARWILKAGDLRDRVVYLIQVDPAAKLDREGIFQGEIVASHKGNQSAVPILGETKIDIAGIHWVDANGDGHIDDVEMLEGSFTIEDMAGVHIDWNDLEALWDAGKYVWSHKKGQFVPENRPN